MLDELEVFQFILDLNENKIYLTTIEDYSRYCDGILSLQDMRYKYDTPTTLEVYETVLAREEHGYECVRKCT